VTPPLMLVVAPAMSHGGTDGTGIKTAKAAE